MKALMTKNSSYEPINVLLIGNNPIELGPVLEKLRQVRSRKVVSEIAFDLPTITERLLKFRPNFILIDDNIGRAQLAEVVGKLSSNRRTRGIPITVLKNNNYSEALASINVQDYLLKQNLTTEALYNTIKSTLRFRRTQELLNKAFSTRKSLLKKMLDKGGVLNLIG